MIYLAASLAIACFAIGLGLFRIIPAAARAVQTSRDAVRMMADRTLDDAEKEQAVQKAALSLIGSFISISARGAGAAVLSLLLLFAFEVTGFAPIRAVTQWLATWEAIVAASVIMTFVYFVGRRR